MPFSKLASALARLSKGTARPPPPGQTVSTTSVRHSGNVRYRKATHKGAVLNNEDRHHRVPMIPAIASAAVGLQSGPGELIGEVARHVPEAAEQKPQNAPDLRVAFQQGPEAAFGVENSDRLPGSVSDKAAPQFPTLSASAKPHSPVQPSASEPASGALAPDPPQPARMVNSMRLHGQRLVQAAGVALLASCILGVLAWPASQGFSWAQGPRLSSGAPGRVSLVSAALGLEGGVASGGSAGGAAAVKMLAVVPGAQDSPLGAPWDEVMHHIAQRLAWTDPDFEMQVVLESTLATASGQEAFLEASASSQILLGAHLSDPAAVSFLQQHASRLPRSATLFGCAAALQALSRLDGTPQEPAGPLQSLLARYVSFSGPAKAARVGHMLNELWGRKSSDDLLFVLLVIINEYVRTVPVVASTTKGFDLPSLQCMLTHCRQNILDCVNNPTCKSALDCLQGCGFNDQVCQYRCIVSYETPELEQFSLCILQKHNCRSLSAEIPMRPDPSPMSSFRGQPMSHEVAEDLFVGWLDKRPHSWLIVGGKNPAYDYFPCQFQIFYRGKARGSMWYEPVFKVKTLDNREVWRQRKYRVRRGQVPGTFHLSVLDNGVTSNEFWRTLDCADDLSFCLFYYSGAASAAGLSYSGAVLGTPDGQWPEAHVDRLKTALDRAGIKMWELTRSNNDDCADAPLDFAKGRATGAW